MDSHHVLTGVGDLVEYKMVGLGVYSLLCAQARSLTQVSVEPPSVTSLLLFLHHQSQSCTLKLIQVSVLCIAAVHTGMAAEGDGAAEIQKMINGNLQLS